MKIKLPQLITNYATTENFAMILEKGVDKAQTEVEIRFRTFNQLKSCKAGNQLKFTVNCYHTSTSMLVNGSKLELFTENILPKLLDKLTPTVKRLQ